MKKYIVHIDVSKPLSDTEDIHQLLNDLFKKLRREEVIKYQEWIKKQ